MSVWSDNIVSICKLMIGITGTEFDTLFAEYFQQGIIDIVDFANADNYDYKYDNVLKEYMVLKFNRRGVEGEVSHTSNGISRNYGNSDPLMTLISKRVIQQIRPTNYVYPVGRYTIPTGA